MWQTFVANDPSCNDFRFIRLHYEQLNLCFACPPSIYWFINCLFYQAIAPIVIFGSLIFAQKINSTCLALNSLTATRHGVIIVWQKLKIVAYTRVRRAWVRMWVCGLRVFGVLLLILCILSNSMTKRPSQLLFFGWGDSKSQSNCLGRAAPLIRCHFDASVSMWVARNIHTSNDYFFFVPISCHWKMTAQNMKTKPKDRQIEHRRKLRFCCWKNAFNLFFIVNDIFSCKLNIRRANN